MSRRERLERKAERRREWAEGRDQKAASERSSFPESLRRDWAFITQPGRIPERERMNRSDERAYEHSKMAAHHREKAAGIERQLDRSIFSDDDDAVEALKERIAKHEAERDKAKKVNAAWRKAKKPKANDPEGWEKVAGFLGVEPDSPVIRQARLNMARDFCDRAPFPPYVLSNLGGRIKADRDRIATIEAQQERQQAAEAAGGVLIDDDPDTVSTLTFDEKPPREILSALKEAGFQWGRGSWSGYRVQVPEIVREYAEEQRVAAGWPE